MVTKSKRPKGLGRGLDALLGADTNALEQLGQDVTGNIMELPTGDLQAGKYQPRTLMDEESIKSLAASIKQQGLMQPIIVRKITGSNNDTYEVIAGERRLRAAKLAQLSTVPVIIKDVDDENAAIMALVENIQREDLNPLEEARGLKRLLDEFALTHEQISDVIGRSRSATSNLLRLLNLAMPVQEMLLGNQIDMGHARALLSLPTVEQIQIAHHIVARALSVRETERLVNGGLKEKENKTKALSTPNADIAKMQDALSDRLGTSVELKANAKGKGKLTLAFHDWEQFQGLLDKLKLRDLLEQNDR